LPGVVAQVPVEAGARKGCMTCYAVQYEDGIWRGKVVDNDGTALAVIGSQDGSLNRDDADRAAREVAGSLRFNLDSFVRKFS